MGYTEAMSLDELGTLAALAESRSVFQAAVVCHRGRIFSIKGDSIFVEYGSSYQGLRSAAAIQRALSFAESQGRKVLRFRIGLHVGRVSPDGRNLLGETINIAARLERLALPGSVCISGQIRDCAEALTISRWSISDHRPSKASGTLRVLRCVAFDHHEP